MQRRGGSFFGRRKGKALRPGQQRALASVLPRLLLDTSAPAPDALGALFPAPVDAVYLEIGFGGAEHLICEAERRPQSGFIGVEPFVTGLAKAATAIEKQEIRNVRIQDQDASALLDWLPPASLRRIDLLFPDPWPKKRHWKRRFVNAANLDRMARCLEAGGTFRFASDVESYVEWALEQVAAHGGLKYLGESAGDHAHAWDGWPGTRYEAKAIAAGRRPAYLTFRKTG